MMCELCEREVYETTKHHLVPKQKMNKRWKKSYKKFNKPIWERTIKICIPCSKQIHALFTNRELKENFDSLEKLKADLKTQKWIEWVGFIGD